MKKLLSFFQYGKGEPLVFLHGYLENKNLWKDFVINFKNYNCVCVDLPGCGESEVLINQTIDSMAEALKTTLEALNINKATFIGHSMGGYVALSFAEQFPSLVKGLVLLNSHPFADSDEKRKNREQEVFLIEQGKKSLLVNNFIPKLYAANYQNKEKIELSRTMAELTCPQGMIACLKAMASRKDRTHILNEAIFPILWIYGKHDMLFSADLADNFRTENSRVIKKRLEEAAHMGMFEAEEEVVKVVQQFLLLCA